MIRPFPFVLLLSTLWASATLSQAPLPVAPVPDVDTSGAQWIPAAPGNYAPANRPLDEPIDRVIIHDIEGTAQTGIGIFQRAGAKVSAHYIVGGDGQIYQMVRERDVAYHAGNSPINHRAVGIETEGFAYRPGFYNPVETEAVAKLVRQITTRYAIPRDRSHIIGHAEVPNPRDPTRFGGISGHTDPGPYWNWNAFMALVRNDSLLLSAEIPATIRPGEQVRAAVTFQNSGDDAWPANLAANPRDGLSASGPVAFLGTFDGKTSQFWNLEGWISPTLAAGAALDTAPGAAARFEFALRGPRELGEMSEKLRLSLQPTAAQGQLPTYFGDVVPISLRVVPWNIDATPIVSESNRAGAARWSAKLPLGGWWAVYLTPPTLRRRARTPLRYALQSGGVEESVLLAGETGEQFAGFYRFAEVVGGRPTLDVRLEAAPENLNLATEGAVRLVGPFPGSSDDAPPEMAVLEAAPLR